MIEINITDSSTNNKFWTQLFRIINKSYKIDYVKYKNKKYFNCSNTWYDATTLLARLQQTNIKPCHKDHKCDGYRECDNNRYCKKNVESNEIEYVYSGTFNLYELYDEDYDDYDDYDDNDFDSEDEEIYNSKDKQLLKITNKKPNEIISQISKLNLFQTNEIKFISNKNIKIINRNGFNKDHRGSDHTLLKLPFVSEVDLGKEFTLYDLLVSNSNLKSHKFENWYELYCGTDSIQTNNSIIVRLNFDHGS